MPIITASTDVSSRVHFWFGMVHFGSERLISKAAELDTNVGFLPDEEKRSRDHLILGATNDWGHALKVTDDVAVWPESPSCHLIQHFALPELVPGRVRQGSIAA